MNEEHWGQKFSYFEVPTPKHFNSNLSIMENEKLNEVVNPALNKTDVMCALPCPFCGSDAEIETTTFGDSMTDNFRVNCKQKGHSLDWWSDTVDEAILVWNERQ